MSKTIELAKHLEKLHINNMYKSDFYWTWDKTDDDGKCKPGRREDGNVLEVQYGSGA